MINKNKAATEPAGAVCERKSAQINSAASEKLKVDRVALYDNFRGIAVILYIFSMMSNLIKKFKLPYWMVHTWSLDDAANQVANGNLLPQQLFPFFNITLADLGPVFFYFILGLTIIWAFQRRKERDGLKAAYQHILYRNLAIIGVAAVMVFLFNAIGRMTSSDPRIIDWNQLASIGLVGIMLMPFVNKGKWTRLISGIAILTVYQIFLPQIIRVLGGEEGGIAACFGFLGVTLIITFLADLQREKGLKWFAAAVGITLAIAALLSWLLPAHYREFNTTYQITALAFISVFFLLYCLLDKYVIKKAIPFISWMGKNLFLYYLILQVARVGIKELQKIIAPDGVTIFGMIMVNVVIIVLFGLLSWWLERKKFIFKL